MKLLFFISSMRGGGAERVMSILCNELVERGHEVYLATNTKIPFAYHVDNRVMTIDLFPKRSDKRGVVNKLRNRLTTYKRIRKIVRDINPCVVTSFILDMNTDVIIATRGLKVPVIASEHYSFDVKLNYFKSFKRFQINKLAKYVTILTQGDYEYIGDKLRNKVVMPNPLSFNISKGDNKREKVVLAAGSIDRWEGKGFDILIKTWGNISYRFPDWRLQIAGGGSDESFDNLKSIAEQNNVLRTVDFLGFQSHLDKLFQQKAIFVLSSRYEGFGMVLLEAMSQGAACIAFDCKTGPREIITNNVSGLLVEDQNMKEMEKALISLMLNEGLREQLSKGGFKEVERFTLDKIVDKWEELFNNAIN